MEPSSDPRQTALREILSVAAACLDSGSPEEAIRVLQSNGGFALNNPVGRNILGEVELQRGRAVEALAAFEGAIQLAPHFAEAHANRGAALIDLGRLKDALDAERRALRFKPELAMAHFNRGVVLVALKRRDEAIEAFGAALDARADFAEALLNRGAAFLDAGRPVAALADFRKARATGQELPGLNLAIAEAERVLGDKQRSLAAAERALALDSGDSRTLAFMAGVLIETERYADALPLTERLLAAAPADADARRLRFLSLRGLGRFEDALAMTGTANGTGATGAEDYAMRALLLTDLRRMEAALDAFLVASRKGATGSIFDQARAVLVGMLAEPDVLTARLPTAEAMIARAPDNAEAYLHRARVMVDLRRSALALADAETAIGKAPQNPRAHTAKAAALIDLERVEEAVDAIRLAGQLGASHAEYHFGRAVLMSRLGESEAAAEAYRAALVLNPGAAEFHHSYGMSLLQSGNMEDGWREHEWRLKRAVFAEMVSSAPHWQGEDLTGKRVLVRHEQGMGDNIQFARFAPELAARTSSLTVLTMTPLVTLLRRSLAPLEVSDSVAPRIPFDFQMAVMSLPFALGKRLDTVTGRIPYILPDPGRVAKWRDRLDTGGFRVGIVWQGNPSNARDASRSAPLSAFAPLAAVPGVRLVSLQALHGLDQLDALPDGMRVERFAGEVERNPDGFEEIAAMMQSLDLVVATDTAVVHLAGALGRPTWIALGRHPDWRWMHKRTDTPWYPSARLFRQDERHWPGVFADMAQSLAELAAAKRAG